MTPPGTTNTAAWPSRLLTPSRRLSKPHSKEGAVQEHLRILAVGLVLASAALGDFAQHLPASMSPLPHTPRPAIPQAQPHAAALQPIVLEHEAQQRVFLPFIGRGAVVVEILTPTPSATPTLTLASTPTETPTCTSLPVGKVPVPTVGAYIGAFIDLYEAGDSDFTPLEAQVGDFRNKTGRNLFVGLGFMDFSFGFPTSRLQRLVDLGVVPLLTWTPSRVEG